MDNPKRIRITGKEAGEQKQLTTDGHYLHEMAITVAALMSDADADDEDGWLLAVAS